MLIKTHSEGKSYGDLPSVGSI